MAKKKKIFSKGLTWTLALLLFLMGAVGGFALYVQISMPTDSDVFIGGDLLVAFPELGNQYTGDCTYIKAGENDILIDAGSKTASVPTIQKFLLQRK